AKSERSNRNYLPRLNVHLRLILDRKTRTYYIFRSQGRGCPVALGDMAYDFIMAVPMIFKSIRQHLASVIARAPAARCCAAVLLTYPGVHVLFFQRVAHWLWRHNRRLMGRSVSQLGRGLTGIEIHPGATVGRRLFIDHGMGVVIGETAEVGDDVTL